MEVPELFVGGGYIGVRAGEFSPEKLFSDQKLGEHFTIDDLLDFSKDDAIVSDDYLENIVGISTDSSTVNVFDGCNSSVSGCENHFAADFRPQFPGELCIPYDELPELEWLSNFVEDSFSAKHNLQTLPLAAAAVVKSQSSESSSSSPLQTYLPETPPPAKARSKRSRAAPCDWSTRVLQSHSLGVMHRDLKPENFLLVNKDDDFSLKAIDFGLSVFFKPGQVFTDVVGSPYYVAPEVLLKHYGPEADVWTAGVILYILLSGVPPFWAETQQGIFDAVLKGHIDFESDPWPVISNSGKDLIRKMLCSRPSERLTAHEVLCHPWICENGVAPDRALDPAVLSRLKQFSAMNKLKKMALRVIAESLSEEEIAGLREMFTAMDTDNSGAITFDELKAGLRRYGSTLKDIEIRDLMDAADVDNSGTIDYGEFIAATVHLNKLEREEHLVAAFQYFDKDGSGYITVDELQQACEEHNMTDVFLEDVIKEVDQDNDGRIDYGEFVAMMQKGNAGLGRRTMRNSLNMSMRDAPGAH